MAAIHRTSTSRTIRASSARTIMGDDPPAPNGGGETEGGVGSVGATADDRERCPVSTCSGNSVVLKFSISFWGKIPVEKTNKSQVNTNQKEFPVVTGMYEIGYDGIFMAYCIGVFITHYQCICFSGYIATFLFLIFMGCILLCCVHKIFTTNVPEKVYIYFLPAHSRPRPHHYEESNKFAIWSRNKSAHV